MDVALSGGNEAVKDGEFQEYHKEGRWGYNRNNTIFDHNKCSTNSTNTVTAKKKDDNYYSKELLWKSLMGDDLSLGDKVANMSQMT